MPAFSVCFLILSCRRITKSGKRRDCRPVSGHPEGDSEAAGEEGPSADSAAEGAAAAGRQAGGNNNLIFFNIFAISCTIKIVLLE